MKNWLKISISFLLIFIFLSIIWLIRTLRVPEYSTGYLVLITGSTTVLVVGIGILFYSLVQIVGESRERKMSGFRSEIGSLLVELFTSKPNDPGIYRTAEKLAYTLREAAYFFGVGKRIRGVYKSNFVDRLVAFRAQTDAIPKHHRGGNYLHEMRKDFYDGRIDNPTMLKAAFKFLEGMEPYGDVSKVIYPLIKRIF